MSTDATEEAARSKDAQERAQASVEAAEAEASAPDEVKSSRLMLKPVIEPTPSTRSVWTRVHRPFVFGFLLTLGALAAVVLGLAISSLSTVLIYIALALFAALGLDPAVRFFERRGLSRPWAIVVVFVSLVIVLGVVLWAVVPTVVEQVSEFVTNLPETIAEFIASDFYGGLQAQFGATISSLVEDVQAFLTNPGNIALIGGGALQIGASIATGISGAVIVLVLTLYFVATLPVIKASMLRFVPARDRNNAAHITEEITESVGGYVMGMAILAFCNAVLVFLLYLFLGLPFPMLMATIAFLITLIPLVGSLLFWIIGSGLALFNDPIAALIFAIAYLVYMQVEAYVMTPRVMNRTISIPGSLVVIC